MREDPKLETAKISACIAANYGFRIVSVTFLPIGFDLSAFVYKVVSRDENAYFLKIRSGPVHEPSLLVPRALIDRGVGNIHAPLPTRSLSLWCSLEGYDGYTAVLYPFIQGDNAMLTGMRDEQWREFGSTLHAVHASELDVALRGLLPVETFALPSATLVRRLLELVDVTAFEYPAAKSFAAFWRERAERIRSMLE
nr:hypothetical protein [Chloroflexota bacterium]